MTSKQMLISAVVIALVCCAVMWWLESYRMAKIGAEWRIWVDGLPSASDRPLP